MENRRKYRRFVLEGMDVFAKTIYDNEIEVLDLSNSGALISCSKRFNMGGSYLFKFEHNDKVFAIKCSVVRSTLSSSKAVAEGGTMPIYTTGIMFQDLLDDKKTQLTEFIADTIKSLRERKMDGLQVTLHMKRAILCYIGTHSVKDISLGGIRIETEEELQFDPVFDMEIVLSENEVPINNKGRIAYGKEIHGENGKRYSVGIEFIDMPDSDKLRIKEFLAALP